MSPAVTGFKIEHSIISSGFDGRTFWAQARGGVIPGKTPDQPPTVVVTAQPALRSGSDIFYALSQWHSTDLGKTWQGPVEHQDSLGRRPVPDGTTIAICDMTPGWHAATKTLLTTGHTVQYQDDKHPMVARARQTAYSTFDPGTDTWKPWQTLAMPDRPELKNAGAGSAQRYDLKDGTILLPIYFKPISEDPNACNTVTVMRCGFNGTEIQYLEHGTELTVAEPRGLCEPSITRFKDRYYLTLRNDVQGYVAVGDDGLTFNQPVPWRFDDGTELGNYNTQQHWVTHSKGLFLVYTRRGLDNDHVFRHRAPLMIARVDPDRLVIIKETEQELVPNRGARLGNFSVCDVGPDETWVVVAEWMQPDGCEKYGSDNTIWAARIIWQEA